MLFFALLSMPSSLLPLLTTRTMRMVMTMTTTSKTKKVEERANLFLVVVIAVVVAVAVVAAVAVAMALVVQQFWACNVDGSRCEHLYSSRGKLNVVHRPDPQLQPLHFRLSLSPNGILYLWYAQKCLRCNTTLQQPHL